ncbi:hypothetical protein, partial [uncultured Selenomonas sp.]|uniref:hypothetical protein n=1 Tax=uncultured Selenomonas sp. TaxID=159275 RepID=UPI0028DC4F23
IKPQEVKPKAQTDWLVLGKGGALLSTKWTMPSREAARKGAPAASRHGRRSFRVVHPRPFLALDLLDLLFDLLHEAVVRGYAIDVWQERADRIIDIAPTSPFVDRLFVTFHSGESARLLLRAGGR